MHFYISCVNNAYVLFIAFRTDKQLFTIHNMTNKCKFREYFLLKINKIFGLHGVEVNMSWTDYKQRNAADKETC